jgi:hypothetical protein
VPAAADWVGVAGAAVVDDELAHAAMPRAVARATAVNRPVNNRAGGSGNWDIMAWTSS